MFVANESVVEMGFARSEIVAIVVAVGDNVVAAATIIEVIRSNQFRGKKEHHHHLQALCR